MGFDSWVRRSPGGGHGNPLQYSCLEDSMTEEPGRLQSIALQRIGHDRRDLARARARTHTHTHTHAHTHTLTLTNVSYWYSFQTWKKNLVIQTLNLRLPIVLHCHMPPGSCASSVASSWSVTNWRSYVDTDEDCIMGLLTSPWWTTELLSILPQQKEVNHISCFTR